jgi:DNA polymerase-3 subunit epsilon
MTTLTYDIESTGFAKNRIVQLAAILHSDKELAVMNVLIKPDNWEIEPGAQAVHGISQEDCEKYGVPIGGALWLFHTLCERADVRVAHNNSFDERVVGAEMKLIGQALHPQQLFCTMAASTNLVKIPPTPAMLRAGRRGYKVPKLIEAHTHFFGEGFEGAHDALADVRACLRIYKHLHK